MTITVRAPRLGEGVEELTVGRLLAAPGAAVVTGAPLLELESDKVVTELAAPAAGRLLRALVPEGSLVRVGDPLVLLETDTAEGVDGAADLPPQVLPRAAPPEASAVPAPLSPSPAAPPPPAGAPPEGGRKAPFYSPLARKLAALHGVDLALVEGTGLGGRVMKQDIYDYLERRAGSGGSAAGGSELRPHSLARTRIAENMVRSIRASAPVLTVMEADLSAVTAHRAARKEEFARQGLRLTLTAYFVAAAAAALRRHPTVNASWTEKGLEVHREINIGMAVSLGEEGLLVPVIRRADTLDLTDIARAVEDLARRSRERTLRPDEVRGGTFSLTNHGTGGSLFATPIILQPQVGILGIGSMRKRPVAVQTADGSDAVAVRPMAYLSFVFDHRVMDGEGADRFLSSVKSALEDWR